MILPIIFEGLQGELVYLAKNSLLSEGGAVLHLKRIDERGLTAEKTAKIAERLAFLVRNSEGVAELKIQHREHSLPSKIYQFDFYKNKVVVESLRSCSVEIMSKEQSRSFLAIALEAIFAFSEGKNSLAASKEVELSPVKRSSKSDLKNREIVRAAPVAAQKSAVKKRECVANVELDEVAEKHATEKRRYEKKLQEWLELHFSILMDSIKRKWTQLV